MRSWTFSLTSLLGVMTLVCIDLAAFVSDTRLLTSVAYTLYLGLLCFSLAAAFAAVPEGRAFWLGLAAFGLVYWLGMFEASVSSGNSLTRLGGTSAAAPEPGQRLASDVLDLAEEYLTPRHAVGAHVFARWRGGGYTGG